MNFDPTKPVRTRAGMPARIYAIDGGGDHPIHGAFLRDLYGWTLSSWTLKGEYGGHPGMNLINVEEGELL